MPKIAEQYTEKLGSRAAVCLKLLGNVGKAGIKSSLLPKTAGKCRETMGSRAAVCLKLPGNVGKHGDCGQFFAQIFWGI